MNINKSIGLNCQSHLPYPEVSEPEFVKMAGQKMRNANFVTLLTYELEKYPRNDDNFFLFHNEYVGLTQN